MSEENRTVTIEDAQIIYRNFAGKEGQYNRAGSRNFCVILDQETADQMATDGWNVRTTKVQEEGDVGQPYLSVEIGYKVRPPRVVLITSRGRTTLDESTLEILDWVEIRIADLIVNPYMWTVNGKTGVKAYLKTLFITIEEDYLERKYGIDGDEVSPPIMPSYGDDPVPLDEQ